MNDSSLETKKSKKAGHWSKKEHALFLQGIKLHGKNWKKIAGCVGTRSSNQIRSHAQKYFIKLEKKKNSSTEEPDINGDPYLFYFQMLSCNAYFKFFYENACTTRTTQLSEPVKIIRENEGILDDTTSNNL